MHKHQNPFEGMPDNPSQERRRIFRDVSNDKDFVPFPVFSELQEPLGHKTGVVTDDIRNDIRRLFSENVIKPQQLQEFLDSLDRTNLVGLQRQAVVREIVQLLLQKKQELSENEMVLMRGASGIFWDIEKQINDRIFDQLKLKTAPLTKSEKNILSEIAIFTPVLADQIYALFRHEDKEIQVEERKDLRKILERADQNLLNAADYEVIFRFPLSDMIGFLNNVQLRHYLEHLVFVPTHRPQLRKEVKTKALLFLQQQLSPDMIRVLFERFRRKKPEDTETWERVKKLLLIASNGNFAEPERTLMTRIQDARDSGDVQSQLWEQAENELGLSFQGETQLAQKKERELKDMKKAVEVLGSKYSVKVSKETEKEFEGVKSSEKTAIQEIRMRADAALSGRIHEEIDRAIRYGADDLEQKLNKYTEMLKPIRQDLIDHLNEAASERGDQGNWGEAIYVTMIDRQLKYISETLKIVKANQNEEEAIRDFSELDQAIFNPKAETRGSEDGQETPEPETGLTDAIPPEAFKLIGLIRKYMLDMKADAERDPYQSPEDFGNKWKINGKKLDTSAMTDEDRADYEQVYTDVPRSFLLRPDVENNKIDFYNRDFLVAVLDKSGVSAEKCEEYLCAVGFSQKKVIEKQDEHGELDKGDIEESESGGRFFRRFAQRKSIRSAMLCHAADVLEKLNENTRYENLAILEGKDCSRAEILNKLLSIREKVAALGITEEFADGLNLLARRYDLQAGIYANEKGSDKSLLYANRRDDLAAMASLRDYLDLNPESYVFRIPTVDLPEVLAKLREMGKKLSRLKPADIEASKTEVLRMTSEAKKIAGNGRLENSGLEGFTEWMASGQGLDDFGKDAQTPSGDPIGKAKLETLRDTNGMRILRIVSSQDWIHGESKAQINAKNGTLEVHEDCWKAGGPELTAAIRDGAKLTIEKPIGKQLPDLIFESTKKRALQEFAEWTKTDASIDDFGKDKLLSLTDLKGKPILKLISKEEWKHGDKIRARFSEKGEIEIRQDIWDEGRKELTLSIRHEAYHAIDGSTKSDLSGRLYQKLKTNLGTAFDEKYAQFNKILCEREGKAKIKESEVQKELFAYLLAGDSLKSDDYIDAVAEIRNLSGAGAIINEFKSGEAFQEGVNKFVENGIKVGLFDSPVARNRIGSSYHVPEVDLGNKLRDQDILAFKNKRSRILRKMNGVRDYGKIDDDGIQGITLLEDRMLELEELVRDGNYTEEMKSQLTKIEEMLDNKLLELAQIYTGEESFLNHVWDNTTFLALADIGTMWKTFWKFVVNRHEQNSNMRVGKAGKAIFEKLVPNLANEFDNKRERTEREKIDEYAKGIKEKDGWEIMERVEKTHDKFELRACIEVLAKKGAIDWRDQRFWRAFEQHQSSIRFIDADAENTEFLKSKLHSTCAILYDNDFFRDIDRQNITSYDSVKKAYIPQADENISRLNDVIYSMIVQKRDGGKVEPARYEMYVQHAIEKNKSNPCTLFWFILQGINYGLLSVDRANTFDAKFLNNCPPVQWFTEYKPTPDQVRSIANMFPPGKKGEMPNSFFDYFESEIMCSNVIRERMTKSCSERGQDHDWAAVTTQLGTFSTAHDLLLAYGGRPSYLSSTGYPNVMVGHLQRITSLARENKAGRIKKAFLKEEITRHIDYVCAWNSIIMRRAEAGEKFYKLDSAELENEPRAQANYLEGKSKKKKTSAYLAANDYIISQVDPDLFKLLRGNINGNLNAINDLLLKEPYDIPKDELPKTDMEVLSNMSKYISKRLNGDEGDQWLDKVMEAALEQYKKDHKGELGLAKGEKSRYDYGKADSDPPSGASLAMWEESKI